MTVVLAVGVFALFEYKNKPQEIDVAKLLVSNASANGGDLTLSNKDTDKDGLLDWEEALWKTDINNPDTDGDGTPDGQEIKDGRDPAKAGPDDKIENYDNFQSSSQEVSHTETLAEQFLVAYSKLVQSGDLSEANKTKIISDLIKENISKEISFKIYTEKDIIVKKDSSVESLKNYGNELGLAILNNLPKKTSDEKYPVELIYLKKAVETKNPADIAKFDSLIKNYTKMIADILLIEIPESVQSKHLAVLNETGKMSATITSFKNAFVDPLKTLQGVSYYTENIKNLHSAFLDLHNFLKVNGVLYSKTEPGYIFANVN